MKQKLITTLTMLITLSAISYADVKLPAVISDHMVLQQNSKANIWGQAQPGEKIEVKGSWQWLFGSSTTADKDGNWKLSIPTPKAGGPFTITIKANNTITLEDILVGEVWICSGQSNMEWQTYRAKDADKYVPEANRPNIRLFTVPRTTAIEPKTDTDSEWLPCTPETVRDFSAVGYFFGLHLQQELDVPIGLINSAWGGTVAQAWTPGDMLADYPDYNKVVQQLTQLNPEQQEKQYYTDMAEWQKKLAQVDPGTKDGYKEITFNDSDWQQMDQPIKWSQTELDGFDGIVWYRKITNLPPSWTSKDLTIELGPIDDYDTVYFNGRVIGETFNWNTPRKYTVPAELAKVGKNIIAVRVIDGQSEGGFCGNPNQMIIYPQGTPKDKAATLAGAWKYKKTTHIKNVPTKPELLKNVNQNTPSVLYNGMISPLVPFTVKGAIWYQGESNASKPIEYRTLFPNMINSWRTKWNIGDFPFYYVQIAPYHYRGQGFNSAMLREAQTISLATKNTGMVVVSDIGNNNDIHPRNKFDVGQRLSLWALAKDYGKKDIVYSGPLYKSMKIEGNKIRLFFDYTGSGLVAKDGPLTDFTISGDDKFFVNAEAVIDGDTVVVSSEQVPEPVAVRFAFTNTNNPNFFNKEGLPASSFRTDNWKE